jgi:hypothetical protein
VKAEIAIRGIEEFIGGDAEIFESLKSKWVGEVTANRRIVVCEGETSAETKAGPASSGESLLASGDKGPSPMVEWEESQRHRP